ncbi:MAG: c-type cytochrome [Solirubrobacterales bacterium]
MRRTRSITAIAAIALAAGPLLVGCGDGDSGETVEQETVTAGSQQPVDQDQPLAPVERRGRALFVENCGSCHTLDAAGTNGQIGPNLDEIPLDEQEVLTAIRIGGRGSGNMPRNLVRGQDAAAVAAFVAGSGTGASGP